MFPKSSFNESKLLSIISQLKQVFVASLHNLLVLIKITLFCHWFSNLNGKFKIHQRKPSHSSGLVEVRSDFVVVIRRKLAAENCWCRNKWNIMSEIMESLTEWDELSNEYKNLEVRFGNHWKGWLRKNFTFTNCRTSTKPTWSCWTGWKSCNRNVRKTSITSATESAKLSRIWSKLRLDNPGSNSFTQWVVWLLSITHSSMWFDTNDPQKFPLKVIISLVA